MKAAYFTAAIPEPFRILGLKLKPLSLGRYRLMRRFDCAFVADEARSATAADLILGVLICSMRCDDFLKFIESDKFGSEIKKWGKRVSSSPLIGAIPWIGKWWRKRHGFNIIEKIVLFKRYVEEGSTMPDYIEEKEPGSSGAHWFQAVETALKGQLGWRAEDINEEPMTKAFLDYFTWAESQGAIRLMTESEEQMGEENAKIFEEALGAQN